MKNNGDPAEVSSGGAGGLGTGGAVGTGGALGDSGVTVACSDDGGLSPPAFARQCTQDSDCSIQIAPRCCGANGALGVAKSEASVYSGCFTMSPSACSGLGCATYFGYVTDTGRTTPWSQSETQPIDLVVVRCAGHLCTTDVVPTDGGQDAAYAADAALDAGEQSCGSGTCHSGQACVLRSGGPALLCQAPGDGGCPPGLMPSTSCYDPSTGLQRNPGCTTPVPAPACVNVPNGCSDLCACVCPTGGGGTCSLTPAYLLCALP